MTISMKSFVVLVFVVGTALCAPDTRGRREVLPGDPRYGTDYRHQHHHHEGGNGGGAGGNIQVVKSIGRYAGTFTGSGPSASGSAPITNYGPPSYQPGTPIRQPSYQPAATHQSAPVQAPQPQQHYHPVEQAPQRRPSIPATSYGVPQYQYKPQPQPQPQPQPNYVQQPTYQVPQQRPVPFQTYGPPPQQPSPSVNRPQQLPQPTPNNGHFAPAVEQRPVVHYQPQQQQQQHYQPPAPVVQHVHVEHRPQPQQVHHVHVEHHPQPQPQQVQHVHVEHRPQPQQVSHVHVEHQQPQSQHVHVQHVEHHQQQTHQTQQVQQVQHVQHHVNRPVTSYGTPVEQSQPAHEYVPQFVEASAPVSQEQVSYNVVHDEPAEGDVRASGPSFPTFEFPALSDSQSDNNQFGGFSPSSIPFFGGGNNGPSSSSSGGSSFPGVPPQFTQFPQFPPQFSQVPSQLPQFPTQIPSQVPFLNPSQQNPPCTTTQEHQPNNNGGNDASHSEAESVSASASSSESESSSNSDSDAKTRSFPTLDLQSNSVADYQNVGSGRSGVSSGYPREQPQPTLQYESPVSPPVAESVVVESVPQNPSTNTQNVDSNGGYIY